MAHNMRFDSNSTNIAAVAFEVEGDEPLTDDGDELGTMTVTFQHNGAVYRYLDVPLALYNEMHEAEQSGGSVGRLFSANVRNTFECQKVSS